MHPCLALHICFLRLVLWRMHLLQSVKRLAKATSKRRQLALHSCFTRLAMWRMQRRIRSIKLSENAIHFPSKCASRKSALQNSFERWVTSRESSRLQPVQSVDKASAPRATTPDPAQEESWNAAADRAPSSSSGVGPAQNGAGATADADSPRRGPLQCERNSRRPRNALAIAREAEERAKAAEAALKEEQSARAKSDKKILKLKKSIVEKNRRKKVPKKVSTSFQT